MAIAKFDPGLLFDTMLVGNKKTQVYTIKLAKEATFFIWVLNSEKKIMIDLQPVVQAQLNECYLQASRRHT